MANMYSWITDSTANPPSPPPPNPELADQSTIVKPYIYPLPPPALVTTPQPPAPFPPGEGQPDAPTPGDIIPPGPQEPPMGPYGTAAQEEAGEHGEDD